MKTRRAVIQLLRYILCIALLWYLFRKVDGPEIRAAIQAALKNWPWLLSGTALTFCGLYAGVIRWYRMLQSYGMAISFKRVFQILFIGQFFNAFMPGACGGDVVRAFYVTHESVKGTRAEAATTVIADRLIGLLTLVAWCSVVIILRLGFFLNHPQTKIPGLLMVGFLVVALVGSLVFFRIHIFERWSLFKRLEEKLRLGPVIRRAYDTLYALRHKPFLLIEAGCYSLLNMAFLTLACMHFGKSIGLELAAREYFTFFPIITVLASVPITPGALGLREGLFEKMFAVVGVAASKAVLVSLLVYLGGVACSLLGGLIFMRYTSTTGTTIREEWARLKLDQD
jgi:uncharacterized protein (TIRG00374 family)